MNEENSQSDNNDTFYSIEGNISTALLTTPINRPSVLISDAPTTSQQGNLASGLLSFFKSLPSSLSSSTTTNTTSTSPPPPLATPRRPLKLPSPHVSPPPAPVATTSSSSRNKKSVKFDRVNVYLFDRCQGFTSVPSESDEIVPCVSVGMSYKHTDREEFDSIEEYAKFKRKSDLVKLEDYFKKKIKELEEQAIALKSRRPPIRRGAGKRKKARTVKAPPELKESVESQESEPLVDIQKLISSDTELIKISDILENREYYETNPSIDLDVSPDVLCPILDQKERFNLLHNLQVDIDPEESEEIKSIHTSREQCGCLCGDYNLICEPSNLLCSCVQNGIMCQLDRVKYPCHCSIKKCKNPFGFKRFNYQQVADHYSRVLVFQNNQENVFIETPAFEDATDQMDEPPSAPLADTNEDYESGTGTRKRKRKLPASPQKRKKQMKSKPVQPDSVPSVTVTAIDSDSPIVEPASSVEMILQ